ncbi:hypothetical protein EB796_018875 [Bugula neritina]|uniref:Uncharacterized protein n=1 Tax=Bugula neritina TaxID=10212 RepID=A0A7J7JB31_BUGNE|nr:hypothetical protein EB796_018875 [Bugula neritina]
MSTIKRIGFPGACMKSSNQIAWQGVAIAKELLSVSSYFTGNTVCRVKQFCQSDKLLCHHKRCLLFLFYM